MLLTAKINYNIDDKELLAIVNSLVKWKLIVQQIGNKISQLSGNDWVSS